MALVAIWLLVYTCNMKKIIFYILTILSIILLPLSTNASANFYSDNDILFYSESSDPSNSCEVDLSGNIDYAGRAVLTKSQIDAINKNKVFYEEAATTEGIPWQILAVIHLRESNLAKRGPSNGYGPYQITPSEYKIGDYTDEEFKSATEKAATFIKNKAGDRDLSEPDNVKYLLFAYNGMSSSYKEQALNLGFSEEEANNGEGSPYVMNKFDKIRDPSVEPTKTNKSWGQIKKDYGSIEYPANTSHYGAFVYYSVLSGESGVSASGCGSGANDNSLDAATVQNNFSKYMADNNDAYSPASYRLGYNGCTTLSAWFIGEYTSLTYGTGNGEAVVRNLISKNGDKLIESSAPKAPSIFSVAGGARSWGATGVTQGHVGIVLSVDEVNKKATYLHTGSSAVGVSKKSWIATSSYPDDNVTFTYIGDYLK